MFFYCFIFLTLINQLENSPNDYINEVNQKTISYKSVFFEKDNFSHKKGSPKFFSDNILFFLTIVYFSKLEKKKIKTKKLKA